MLLTGSAHRTHVMKEGTFVIPFTGPNTLCELGIENCFILLENLVLRAYVFSCTLCLHVSSRILHVVKYVKVRSWWWSHLIFYIYYLHAHSSKSFIIYISIHIYIYVLSSYCYQLESVIFDFLRNYQVISDFSSPKPSIT